MKRVIRLTESDLTRIVKRVINEQSSGVIKIKAWRTEEEMKNGSARSFNLDTTDHKIQNNSVLFNVTTPKAYDDGGRLPQGPSGIPCDTRPNRPNYITAKSAGKLDYLYISDEGRKALTKLCDAYVSNDTEMDGDYA
jgi:hypothetical protein